ncbi:MAG: LOG family protein [Verrucomicrobiales bacterium]
MQTGKAMIYPLVMVDAPGGTYWQTFVKFIKAELLDNGMISEEDFAFFKVTDNVDEAVAEITGFYRNFHSYRYVNDQLVIRLLRPLTESRVAQLNDEFNDLFAEGGSGKPTAIRQGEALNAEKNEPEIADLPRLIFRHNRSRFGRLRSLIDAVNDPVGFAPE